MGRMVYTTDDDLEGIIKKENIVAVLVSPLRTDDFRNDQELQDRLIGAGQKIYMASLAKEWNGENEGLNDVQLNEVNVEDLLPRQKIEIDMEAIGKLLKDKCILVTGVAGSIGSEMVRQVAKFMPSVMVLVD